MMWFDRVHARLRWLTVYEATKFVEALPNLILNKQVRYMFRLLRQLVMRVHHDHTIWIKLLGWKDKGADQAHPCLVLFLVVSVPIEGWRFLLLRGDFLNGRVDVGDGVRCLWFIDRIRVATRLFLFLIWWVVESILFVINFLSPLLQVKLQILLARIRINLSIKSPAWELLFISSKATTLLP